jgi:hypothetical protein
VIHLVIFKRGIIKMNGKNQKTYIEKQLKEGKKSIFVYVNKDIIEKLNKIQKTLDTKNRGETISYLIKNYNKPDKNIDIQKTLDSINRKLDIVEKNRNITHLPESKKNKIENFNHNDKKEYKKKILEFVNSFPKENNRFQWKVISDNLNEKKLKTLTGNEWNNELLRKFHNDNK